MNSEDHISESGQTYSVSFECANCIAVNHTFVDPSQGTSQEYVEDCQACCAPNILHVNYDEWNQEWMIRAEAE